MMLHQPVLLREVLDIFNPRPGERYIDATVNGGGHARAIAERVGKKGKVVGIDWDLELIEELKAENHKSRIENIELFCANYREIGKIAGQSGVEEVNGILFDLGFSSHHVERSGRGFSFLRDEPLDMRYNPKENRVTAAEIVNQWSEDMLRDVILRYGEERFAQRIARGIVKERKHRSIDSSARLAQIIMQSVPVGLRRTRLHPATRTFQALRIAVNQELESLAVALPAAVSLLGKGGKIAVISFHSLEDRIVKTYMREEKKKGIIRIENGKPIRPGEEEIAANPRARSARLRSAIKL